MITYNFDQDIKISFETQTFQGIEKIGFDKGGSFIVSLYHCKFKPEHKHRRGYFTILPISPRDYRRQNPTQAAFRKNNNWSISIFSDYGEEYKIKTDPTIISKLVEECEKNELVNKDKVNP